MDPYTELEAKFEANGLTATALQQFVDRKSSLSSSYDKFCVVGTDTFFATADRVLRFRRPIGTPGPKDTATLTYKQRRSNGNIRDRVEVDLFLDVERSNLEADAKALVEAMGFVEHFSIVKESTIYDIRVGRGAVVVLALYDVLHQGKISRFLEVEIEKSSSISDAEAVLLLDTWIGYLSELGLGEPINKSLYQLYAPKDDLFLDETF